MLRILNRINVHSLMILLTKLAWVCDRYWTCCLSPFSSASSSPKLMTTRCDPHGKLKDILSDVKRLLLLLLVDTFIGCWPHSNELEMNLIYFQLDLQHIFNSLSTHAHTQTHTETASSSCYLSDFRFLLFAHCNFVCVCVECESAWLL